MDKLANNPHQATQRKWLSFILALSIHLLLLVGLFIGVRWQTHSTAPIEAELWGEIPAMPSPAAQPSVPLKPEPPVDIPDAAEELVSEVKGAPEIALEKQASVLKKARPEPPNPNDVRPAERTANPPISPDPLALDNLLKGAGVSPTHLANQSVATKQATGGQNTVSESYLAQLKTRIRRNTIYPDQAGNPTAVLKIFVLADGTIREVKIISFTGDPLFAEAGRQAVLGLQRLPPLPMGMRFSEHREWTVRTRLRDE